MSETTLLYIILVGALAVAFVGIIGGNPAMVGVGVVMIFGSLLMRFASDARAKGSPAPKRRRPDGSPTANTLTPAGEKHTAGPKSLGPLRSKLGSVSNEESTKAHPLIKLTEGVGEHKYLYRSMLISGHGTLYLDLPYGPPYGEGPGEIPYCRWFGVRYSGPDIAPGERPTSYSGPWVAAGYCGPGIDPSMSRTPQLEGNDRSMAIADEEQIALQLITEYIDRHYNAFAQYIPRATASLEKRYSEEDERESQRRKAGFGELNQRQRDPGKPVSQNWAADASAAEKAEHKPIDIASKPYSFALYGNGWVDGAMQIDEARGICTLSESEIVHMNSHGTDVEYSETEKTMSIPEALQLLKNRPSRWHDYTTQKNEEDIQNTISRLEDILKPSETKTRIGEMAQSFYGGNAQGEMVYFTGDRAVCKFADERGPYAQYVVKLVRVSAEEAAAYTQLGDALVEMTSGDQHTHGLVPVLRADVVDGGNDKYALALMPHAAETLDSNAPVESENAFFLGYALASALRTLHENGYVHMDVKPSNMFKLSGPSGDAWALGDYDSVREIGFTSCGGWNLTWTEAYAAPEVNGESPCAPTMDVYAWGRTMFELFKGRKIGHGPVALSVHYELQSDGQKDFEPRNNPDAGYYVKAHSNTYYFHDYLRSYEYAPPSLVDYRRFLLAQAIMKAMDPDPLRRFADGRELLRELSLIEAATGEHMVEGLHLIGDVAARCAGGTSVIEIPDGITRIYHGAFRGNNDVRAVRIPASVTIIDEYAFAQCTHLQEVRFEGGVPPIDSKVFAGCDDIKRVTVGEAETIYNLPRRMRTLALQAQEADNAVEAGKLLRAHLGAAADAAQAPPDENPVVNFGDFRWQVLCARDGRLLLLADSEVGFTSFDPETNAWRDSKVRAYLNGPFLAESFSETERACIDKTALLTDGSKTDDLVFLLSLEEVTEFLPVERERILYTTTGWAGSWWLRSTAQWASWFVGKPGVLYVGESGLLNNPNGAVWLRPSSSNDPDYKRFIRPALWVKYDCSHGAN